MRVLAVLPGGSLVLGPDDQVLWASGRASALGLVRDERISVGEIRRAVARCRRTDEVVDQDLWIRRPPLLRERVEIRIRVASLDDQRILVLVDDLSEERRVDAVRRDFVANISHELKTPVGALALLAEAVLAAADEPEAVRRFAGRMQAEAIRLGNLVNDVIDLSRVQGDDPLGRAATVPVDRVVADALDGCRTLAAGKDIELLTGDETGLVVYGVESQLVTALRNLVVNAITYSAASTRVAVAARVADGFVEVDVKDQGIGIPPADLDRVFERFYRVDPARSRDTGGTGLGLAIVKHVCRNHGGDCRVWSEVGVGSTFTLRLPVIAAERLPSAPVPESEDRLVPQGG